MDATADIITLVYISKSLPELSRYRPLIAIRYTVVHCNLLKQLEIFGEASPHLCFELCPTTKKFFR
jgi:hypothetical protein